MEEEKTGISLAKTALLSSLITVVIVAGLMFLGRDALKVYLLEESNNSITEPVKELVSADEPLVGMIELSEPAVVSIVVTKDVPVYERYFETVDPWGLFNVPRLRSNGTEEREVGGGSGFIVSNDGMIVTNAHVVSDEEAIYSVLLHDGKSYTVDVLATDNSLDIAILKISEPITESLTYLQFGDSNSLKLGQTVVAIGNALAEFQNSVSVGVVSGLSRSITANDEATGMSERLNQVIQTDAAINPGNSGGPLLNLKGEVIGVSVATSKGADNISFALPAILVKEVVDSVKEYGEIVRPYLGVRYTTITKRVAEANNLPVDYGALVIRGQTPEELAVPPGSPAAKAGIIENDIILSIDGIALKDKDLTTELRSKKVGTVVSLRLLSKGVEKTVEVSLEKAP
ncbi:MAG: trypsin-like peptidase domain-containing protein [Patescibacteria group bacterium]